MKKGFLGVLLAGFVVGVFAQQEERQGRQQAQGAANQPFQAILEDVLLNDFEEAEDWRAIPTAVVGETKIKKVVQRGPIEDVFNPQNLTPEERERFKPGINHVLGVKTYFKIRGVDRVVVKPPHEYVIKGILRHITVWTLGRNFRHTLYIRLRDFKGKIHQLKVGKLNFFGWRKMLLTVPGWLPQSTRYALMDKHLHFVSLVVQSDPHEVGGQFYVYFDDLRAKVDKTEETYPGAQIEDNW